MTGKFKQPTNRDTLEQTVTYLELRYRRLRWGMFGLLALCLISLSVVFIAYLNREPVAVKPSSQDILRVRGLVVVDGSGTERVWIGAPLPDPPILGKRVARGGTAHGILLFDAEGNERSGYVTFDEAGTVMLTLDEIGYMVAQFAAGPAGGVRLRMRGQYRNDVRLGTYEGGPYLKLRERDKELFLQPDGKGVQKFSPEPGIMDKAPVSTSSRVLEGHNGAVSSVSFSLDGSRMASSSFDRTVRVWDVSTGKTLRVLHGHSGEVFTAVFSPDSRYLASSDSNRNVHLWNAASGKLLRKVQFSHFSIAIAFSRDGSLTVGTQDGNVAILDTETGKTLRTLQARYPIYSLAYSPDGQYLATGGPIVLWNTKTGEKVKTPRAPGGVLSMVFSPDSRTLASAHMRGIARLWNITTEKLTHSLAPEVTMRTFGPYKNPSVKVRMPLTAIVFSPDGKLVVTAGADKRVRVWQVSTGKIVQVLEGHTKSISGLSYSSDGKYLASCSLDGSIRVWPMD
jgi:WD40 repeat protein